MKYAIVTVTDGNFLVRSEWSDKDAAKVKYHTLAAALWNDKSFSEGYIAIVDSNLDVVEGYREFIKHPIAPEEPTEE